MTTIIENLLSHDELASIRKRLENATFISGTETAGERAKLVKNNLQLENPKLTGELGLVIYQAMQRSKKFLGATFPVQISAPIFSKYTEGMEYGEHIDNALMGAGRVRTDIAVTILLSSPGQFLGPRNDFTGGQLEILSEFGAPVTPALEGGAAVIYPASSVHRVRPVTSGERLAAVLWIQSMVRRPDHRQILVSLRSTIDRLTALQVEDGVIEPLERNYQNLLREWSEV